MNETKNNVVAQLETELILERSEMERLAEVEQLEAIIAPGVHLNHNETLVADSGAAPAELGGLGPEIEELEPVRAPGVY